MQSRARQYCRDSGASLIPFVADIISHDCLDPPRRRRDPGLAATVRFANELSVPELAGLSFLRSLVWSLVGITFAEERRKVSDGVDAPRRHRCAKVAGVEAPLQRGVSMEEVSIIGLDLAKNVFQAHGTGFDGSVVFRRKLSRAQLLKFMAAQPPCVVAMEACASAQH